MADTFRKVYTPVEPAQSEKILAIKAKADELEAAFEAAVPKGDRQFNERVRLIKIAHTNLEQAVMWAVKAASAPLPEVGGEPNTNPVSDTGKLT